MDRRPEDMIIAAEAASKDEIAIRILLPAARLEHFIVSKQPVKPLLNVAFIDVETTGTDPLADQVIDLDYVILCVNASVNGTVKIPGSGKVKFPTLRFGFSGGLGGASIFGWASAASWFDRGRRRNSRIGPDVLREQVGMPTQAIARAVDLDNDGMVQQPVEQRRCDDGAAEDVAPFSKAAVRGEDHRAFLVSRIDDLEEQVAAARYDREVADLIDD